MTEQIINLPPLGLSGDYKFIRRKTETQELVQETGWMKNLITNAGLDQIGGTSFGAYCCVGTSTGSPAFTDTKLGGLLAFNNSTSYGGSVNSEERYVEGRKTCTFSNGSAAGNVSEVGMASNNNTGTYILFSRARVVDELGNPTTITVLSDEDLIVIYRLRVTQPTGDFMGTAGGYSYTLRPAGIDTHTIGVSLGWGLWGASSNGHPVSFTGFGRVTNTNPSVFLRGNITSGGSLGAIDGDIVGGTDILATVGVSAPLDYTAGNHYLDWRVTIATNSGNGTGINAFRFKASPASWQMVISPSLDKNNTQTLRLTFRTSWARA